MQYEILHLHNVFTSSINTDNGSRREGLLGKLPGGRRDVLQNRINTITRHLYLQRL